jgi:HAD superfamily phosphatase (TIGR01668 family)
MGVLNPNLWIDKITRLTPSDFIDNNIKVVLVDLDNTVLDPQTKKLIPGIKEWIDELKRNNILVCFVSNTISKEKKEHLHKELEVPIVINAIKPFNSGIKRALKILEMLHIPRENVAMIGDQLFTDVLGGNLMGLHTIKVDPISNTNEDSFASKLLRYFETCYLNARAKKGKVKVFVREYKPEFD